jgi:diguanylate cyclase (GGDEF)-like protein
MLIQAIRIGWFLSALLVSSSLFGADLDLDDLDFDTLKSRLKEAPANFLPVVEKTLEEARVAKNVQTEANLLEIKLNALGILGKQQEQLQTSQRGLELAKKLGRSDQAVIFNIGIAEAYSQMSRWKESKTIFENLLSEVEVNGTTEQIARVKSAFGLSCYYHHELNRALELLKSAYEIMVAEDLPQIGVTLSSIALIYDNSAQSETAIQYYLKSLDYYDEEKDEDDTTSIYYNIGRTYLHLNNLEKAEYYLEKSLEINKRLGITQGEAFVAGQLGKLEIERRNFDLARSYLENSVTLAKGLNNDRLKIRSSIDLLKTYIVLGKFDNAVKLEKMIDEFTKDMDNVEVSKELLTAKTELYIALHNYAKAADYFGKLNDVFDDWLKLKSNKQLNEYQVQFDTEIKEKENEILKQNNKLQELRLKEAKNQSTIYVMTTMLFIFVFSFMMIYLWRERRLKAKLERMALSDELTGVANRRAIMNMATEALERFKRYHAPTTFCMLDLDHFKKINDMHGHNVGDQILIIFSKTVMESLRKQDRFGRIGGEEWLMVLPDTRKERVEVIFNRIKHALETVDAKVTITFSLGCSEATLDDQSIEQIIIRADSALYSVKESGRNGYAIV